MIVIGVDIGGTTVKLGAIDTSSDFSILAESNFDTPSSGAQRVAEAIAFHVRELSSAFPEADRIGIGVPGAMNRDRSVVRFPPNLADWKEEPLAEYVREALPEFVRVEVDNDANVATLAEATLGAGKDLTHFVLITLGTGVGGGIYATEGGWSGIVRGTSGGAGEFGHISIDRNGPQCACGSRGCIEAYIGQRYLSNRTKEKLAADASIQSSLRSHGEELTPKIIAAAMEDGDTFAHGVFAETGRLLGLAIANAAKLLDIHTYLIGGGVASAGSVLFESALESARANVLENQRPLIELRKARFGNKAGILGAAILVA